MPMTRARDLASSLGQAVSKNNITLSGGLSVSGLTTYTNKASLPGSYDSDNAGSLAFTTDSDRLYIHTGTGWHNVAIINTTPLWVTQPAGSYTLATDATGHPQPNTGTATEIIVRARDSEGAAITWSATADSAFGTIARITQDSAGTNVNKFIIEPHSQDSVSAGNTSGTVTFKASDGVNILSQVSTFTLEFYTTIPDSEGTNLITKMIGNNGVNTVFDDGSSGNHTVTVNGDTQQGSFSPYASSGYSYWFEQANHGHLEYADSADWDLSDSADWTIEFWVNPELLTNYATIITQVNAFAIELYDKSISGWFSDNGSGNWGILNQERLGPKLNIGEWTHFAIVYDASADTIKSYQNGSLYGTFTSKTGFTGNSNVLKIGQYDGHPWYGGICDLRLVKGKAVYTGNFTPPSGKLTTTGGEYHSTTNVVNPTSSETKLLTCQQPFIIIGKDVTGNHTHTVSTNQVRVLPISPYMLPDAYSKTANGGSVYLDGTGDHLASPAHADFNPGTGAYTVEGWFWFSADTAANSGLFCSHSGGGYGFGMWTTGSILYIEERQNSYGSQMRQTYTWPSNMWKESWHHVAMGRDSTSGTMKAFINGIQVASASSDLRDLTDDGPLHVGTSNAGVSPMTGFLSDFRYIKGTQVYTSAFTPPTAPLTAISNTKFLLSMADANVIDNGGRGVFRLKGTAKSSTGVQKNSIPSLYLDGNSDYIEKGMTRGLAIQHSFTTTNFTIEGWIYRSAVGAEHYIIDNRNGNNYNWAVSVNSSNLIVWNPRNGSSDNAMTSDSTAMSSVNTWYHFAIVRHYSKKSSAVNEYIYINGVQANSRANVNAIKVDNSSAPKYYIGAKNDASTFFNGYISDLRVKKGLAEYPFRPLKETLTSTTSFQKGRTVGGSGGHTKIICCHSSTLTADGSAAGRTLVATNATASTNSPHGGMKSVYFDSTSSASHISANTSTSQFALGTGDYTFETWVNFHSFPQTINTIAGTTISAGSTVLYWHAKSDRLSIGTQDAWIRDNANITWETGKWYHVAVCRISATTTIFVDGHVIDSFGSDTTSYTADGFRVGGNNSGGNPLKGWLSNTRLIVGTGIYQKDFVPSTTALDSEVGPAIGSG
tara:strand:+ start:10870 stop:14193 length:3324 start_codon:yes stop_codon:yes gene_type:complete